MEQFVRAVVVLCCGASSVYNTDEDGHSNGVTSASIQAARTAVPRRAGRRNPLRVLVSYEKGDYRFAREKNCDLRLLDFETFGGFGDGVRRILRQAADQLSNKLSHAQHLDEVTWTTKNWHGLQMQRLSVVLHTAVAWQTVNELACGDSGIVHGAKCIAVLNGVA